MGMGRRRRMSSTRHRTRMRRRHRTSMVARHRRVRPHLPMASLKRVALRRASHCKIIVFGTELQPSMLSKSNLAFVYDS